jgi:hypothetical protein
LPTRSPDSALVGAADLYVRRRGIYGEGANYVGAVLSALIGHHVQRVGAILKVRETNGIDRGPDAVNILTTVVSVLKKVPKK